MENETTKTATDSVNSNDWLEAMRFIGDTTQSCPADMFDWDHPKTCQKACRPEFDELARECWGLYIKEKASNAKHDLPEKAGGDYEN